MKLYVLMEDSKQKNTAFMAEHGLSIYFEYHKKRILFDTGASGSFIYNATMLGIDLAKVDICIISHAHYDHTGGLSQFFAINNKAKVYMKRTVQGDYYTKKLFEYKPCGIDNSIFEKYKDRIVFIDDDTEIIDDIFAANIIKYRRLPQFCSLMYQKQDGKMIKDDLSHELFVTIKQKSGNIVLTGCAHHGLLNILMTAKDKFGKINGVVGGFHLNGTKALGIQIKVEPQGEIRAISKYLNKHKIKKVYSGHCTGEKPMEKLELTARAKKIHAGDIIEIK